MHERLQNQWNINTFDVGPYTTNDTSSVLCGPSLRCTFEACRASRPDHPCSSQVRVAKECAHILLETHMLFEGPRMRALYTFRETCGAQGPSPENGLGLGASVWNSGTPAMLKDNVLRRVCCPSGSACGAHGQCFTTGLLSERVSFDWCSVGPTFCWMMARVS